MPQPKMSGLSSALIQSVSSSSSSATTKSHDVEAEASDAVFEHLPLYTGGDDDTSDAEDVECVLKGHDITGWKPTDHYGGANRAQYPRYTRVFVVSVLALVGAALVILIATYAVAFGALAAHEPAVVATVHLHVVPGTCTHMRMLFLASLLVYNCRRTASARRAVRSHLLG